MTRSLRVLAVGLLVACTVSPFLMSTPIEAQFMAPELEPNLGWLNSDRPLRFEEDLKGHVVVLDFWTYCCINCIHVLPDLKYLEEKYADEPFVVIGVHSAKFTNEGERQSIRHAMQRYGVRHPVVVDDAMSIWRQYGVRSWPTTVVIGADGRIVGAAPGEGNRDLLDTAVRQALDDARENGTLAEEKTRIVLDAEVRPATGLMFPGKVLAAPAQDRLFVADSSGNRVIVSTFPDEDGIADVVAVFGTGEEGFENGGPAGSASPATFNDPQGFAFDPTLGRGGTLYVADVKNHAVRAIDLGLGKVATIAGDGERSYDRKGGKRGPAQGLASPWALELSNDRNTLYIANAGTHQIWTMDLVSGIVENFAGSGRENSLDGSLSGAALAQPSGLALSEDGRRLYFADSESSSIRVVDTDAGEVRTVVGHNVESGFQNGLFEFGDVDGTYPDARLQHALGVTILETFEGGELLLVADTYNHKVKLVDTSERSSQTYLGSGRGLTTLEGVTPFDEPGGLFFAPATGDTPPALFIADTNNHRVVMVDPISKRKTDVVFRGLRPESAVDLESAIGVSTTLAGEGPVRLVLAPELPEGAKVNEEFPVNVRVSSRGESSRTLAQKTLRADELPFEIELGASDVARRGLVVELSFAYCTEGDDSVCLPVNLVWAVDNEPGDDRAARLTASVP